MCPKEISGKEVMYRDIINNEELMAFVIDINNFQILYCNKWCTKFSPNIKLGEIFIDYKEKKDLFKLNSLNIKDDVSTGELYNKKIWSINEIPIVYKGVQANLVYGKNNIDCEKEIRNFDTLTDSLSYSGFQQYYYDIVKKNQFNYGLCTIDIDKFNYVNNIFGYETGNSILYNISNTLQKFISEDETYCRVNEDKFAIFLKYNKFEELELRVEQLSKVFENMQEKHFKNKKITIVGGICLVNKEKELNIVMDKANIARKTTKGSHSNKFRFYDESLQKESKKEKNIEERMLVAIKNEEFVPFLQAKFDLNTNEICGAEALVRWLTPNGMIFPDEFIPIFEKNGFICTLDFVMYEKVFNLIRKSLDNGINICPISLNVSRGHVKNEKFADRVMDLIRKYNIPLELIELEVTESAFVEDNSSLQYFIGKLKECNIKVSIDDFGTAYSSLNVLKDVDIDVLKIDKDFLQSINFIKVTEIPTKDKIVIRHIIAMAKDLGFRVICEGVETTEQLEFLKEIGCELGQGYLFAKPLSIDDFMERFYK